MKEILISRLVDDGKQTTGYGSLIDGFHTLMHFASLELSWNNNERNISCIPSGEYICKVRRSEKYGEHLHVQNVPGRDMILVHYGNFNSDTKGCILLGERFSKINSDGDFDVANSKKTINDLMEYVNGEDVKLIIKPAKMI